MTQWNSHSGSCACVYTIVYVQNFTMEKSGSRVSFSETFRVFKLSVITTEKPAVLEPQNNIRSLYIHAGFGPVLNTP